MNMLAGRNIVIDPNPAIEPGGDPAIYISDPVTTGHSWASNSASANWVTSSSWNASGVPDTLWIANVRHVTGGAQEAVVSADSTVWELNVSGPSADSMTVRVQSGARLTTFSGANIESGGSVQLQGGILDAQFVDIRGGTLTGSGSVLTGSGPIAGQVENHGGFVAPGDGVGTLNIGGRFVNAFDGTIEFELGGDAAGQFDRIVVDGGMLLDGTLSVSLVNAFVPGMGDSFTLLTSTGDLVGEFETLSLPGGYQWDVEYGPDGFGLNAVVLTVASIGLAGEFNNDGVVDVADYVWWRKSDGSAQGYQDWLENFGMSSPGSGGNVVAGVPEPGVAVLVMIAVFFALSRPSTRSGPNGKRR
jgi:hypothetical protein